MPSGKQVIKRPACLKAGCIKKPASGFIPKRGKARLARRRPASQSCMKKPATYTRVARPSRNLRRDMKPSITIADFFKGERWTTNYLIAKNFLRLPKTCKVCGTIRKGCRDGVRFGLRSTTRCPNSECRHRLTIYSDNPYFTKCAQSINLVQQAAVLFNLSLGISRVQIHLQLGVPHATVERCAVRFETHIQQYVTTKQDSIQFGSDVEWADVECDEVTLARRHTGEEQVTWSQFLGMVQRGRPGNLVIVRLPDRTTGTRAPGPGPLRKVDWQPIYKQFIENRKIILHTDSARAYDAFTAGIGKTRVVHQIKKDAQGNWVQPHFTKYEEVTVEDGKTIAVLAGTQYIDGFGGFSGRRSYPIMSRISPWRGEFEWRNGAIGPNMKTDGWHWPPHSDDSVRLGQESHSM